MDREYGKCWDTSQKNSWKTILLLAYQSLVRCSSIEPCLRDRPIRGNMRRCKEKVLMPFGVQELTLKLPLFLRKSLRFAKQQQQSLNFSEHRGNRFLPNQCQCLNSLYFNTQLQCQLIFEEFHQDMLIPRWPPRSSPHWTYLQKVTFPWTLARERWLTGARNFLKVVLRNWYTGIYTPLIEAPQDLSGLLLFATQGNAETRVL
ncbi:hypothetical protein K1719_003224 [Acacia pycnantha]|nr:hypothetical protein K1719_003224 [Acacia pycnantha]